MALTKSNEQEYNLWLAGLKDKIRNSQLKAALKVNAELLSLYWELGKAISDKFNHSNWGEKIITQLAEDLRVEFKEISGFSRSNLFNIRKWYRFYSMYPEIVQQAVGLLEKKDSTETEPIVQQAVGLFPPFLGLIPWGHHIQIFTKSVTIEEAIFYIQQTANNNWSRNVLIHQIESGLYHRKGKSLNNFQLTLPKPQSDLANELLKNPLHLEFLNLGEEANERDLEKAILSNIKKFLLELGTGFSFFGQQHHLTVGGKDFYIDLIFYHTKLHCYFVVELKVTEFEPEHAGKLEFYITAVDEQVKTPEDNATIGLLLCKTANKVIVEYTLKDKSRPMGIAEYKHVIPKEWENQLPGIEVLKHELEKEILLSQTPIDNKINKLKELVQKIKSEDADQPKNWEVIKRIYTEIEMPLINMIDEKLIEVKPFFNDISTTLMCNGKSYNIKENNNNIEDILKTEQDVWELVFDFRLNGFKNAGTKIFDVWQRIKIQLHQYMYTIDGDQCFSKEERVYRQMHNRNDLDKIAGLVVEKIIDDINSRVEHLVSE